MTFYLRIGTDNAAFEDDRGAELAHLLRIVAERVADGHQAGRVRDSNGNTVGEFVITDGDVTFS